MSDDLVSLRMLIVSDVTSARALWRRGTALAPVPIESIEVATASAAGDLLKRGGIDIMLVDGDLTGASDLVRAARVLPRSPIVLTVVASGRNGRIEGSDGVLKAPAGEDEARTAVERCIRTRMPARTMIVDDSATMRAIVRKILSASRFRLDVSEASEGLAALGKIRDGAVDIVFLDYNMPGLNGIETLSEIRRESPHAAVVMMTSMLDHDVVKRAGASGAIGFLKKPFFPRDVDEVLERHYGLL